MDRLSQRIMGTTVNTAEERPGSSIAKLKSRPPTISKTGSVPVGRFGWFVVVYNIAVILWGAYVRASGSGAGCGSHWPLCNGAILAATAQMQTVIEFTHRVTSAVSLVLVVILLIWCWRRTAMSEWPRYSAIAAAALSPQNGFLSRVDILRSLQSPMEGSPLGSVSCP